MHTVVVIPARLHATRLPRKLLLDLGGKSVLQRVYEQCLLAKGINAVYIATDSREIATHCQTFTENIVMTSTAHQSGTDRIAEAVSEINAEVVVNVQGDEPFIDPALITQVANAVTEQTPMSSAMRRIRQAASLHDPNSVKVVVNHHNEALYFSRLPIPYHRDGWEQLTDNHDTLPDTLHFYQHIGIYGYHRDFLLTYSQMPPSYLERLERLEQLRVLENGYRIQMIETDHDTLGIDTPEDYIKAQERIKTDDIYRCTV